uniref:Uncharacterized protein n=1 Tax=Arundo donax TaxID=35708 RepID=A0A0A9EL23_ARUDO
MCPRNQMGRIEGEGCGGYRLQAVLHGNNYK